MADFAMRIEMAADVHGLLLGDQVRLKQVLTDLVSNAVNFTQEESIKVQMSTKKQTAGKTKKN